MLEGHNSWVSSVVFSHNSKKVASGCDDKTIRIWDAETGECERVLEGHTDDISSVVFSHDSKKVASGSDDETIRIWNAETGACEDIIPSDGYPHVLSFTPDKRGIVTNHGEFSVPSSSQPRAGSAMPWQSSEAPTLACTDSIWVTAAGKDLLWLPSEFRNGKMAIGRSTVAIGCRSGRVVLLEISMADMEQWMGT
jgi:WD40 repeat protein